MSATTIRYSRNIDVSPEGRTPAIACETCMGMAAGSTCPRRTIWETGALQKPPALVVEAGLSGHTIAGARVVLCFVF